MPKRKKGKKKKTTKVDVAEESYRNAPHSFVFQRGHVGKNVKQLVHDVRMVMEPFTAKNLQVRKKNVLKDFVNVAGLLHVSHFMILTKTDQSVNLRMCRLPRGPTLTFKVHNYCLTKDVIAAMRKPNLDQIQYLYHPLLVMNNFTGEEKQIKLMSSMFQNMFPSINVHKVKLTEVKRCVMVNYNPDTKLIDFRHYNIKVVPVGMSKGVKKLIQSTVPDLSNFNDISDFINRAGYASESEGEMDGPLNEVILPQEVKSRGNIKATKSAIRMTELGPRFTLQLVKIEEGICDGQVMFHEFVHKTEAELETLKRFRENKRKLKEARKRQQAENLRKKDQQKEENKQKSLAGMKRKADQEEEEEDEVEKPELSSDDDEVDDAEYFKQEVGHMPDKDSFIPRNKKPRLEKSDQKNVSKTDKRDKQTVGKQGNKSVGKQEDKASRKPGGKFGNKKKGPGDSDFKNKFSKDKGKGEEKKKNKLPFSKMTPMQKLLEKKKRKQKVKEKKLKKFQK